ncbi:Ig-like domain-containing protein [Zunongwangia sp. H14]|uniref:Ig-like domain-containing protein n=1 Tax=Zunongwangia sp. H14 TaxID=3240792 RepID=UPI003565777B
MKNRFVNLFLLIFIANFLNSCSGDDSVTGGEQPDKENITLNAVDDELSAKEGMPLILDALLDNDALVGNARIFSFDSDTSEGGTVEDNRDETYTYTPPEGFQGDDTFTYTICIPGNADVCSTATVTITVGDAGEPVAVDDTYETDEDKVLTIKNYMSNDDAIDHATISEVNTEGTNASVVIEDNGDLIYTPAEGFSGEDSFTYTICDDDEIPNCSTATIMVTVQDTGSPTAEDDNAVMDAAKSERIFSNLLSNDDLLDDATISSVDGTQSQGTVVLNDDGTVTYTPASGFTGEDTFTYTICDDDAEATCSTATVTVSVIEAISFNIPSELEDYYEDMAFSTDADLTYQSLSQFTNEMHTTQLAYTDRHDYLYDADADPNDPDNVILMYSGERRPDDEFQLGDLDDGETYNTEHIYPQSKLNYEIAENDLHHMRVADVNINSERLNYPYTDGNGTYKLVDGNKWFPGDDWRGDVARMVMYINLSYGDSFDEVGSLDLFLEWNREDPVSAFEIQRNNVIEGAQGNRNPFIDNPYLATLIWGGQPAENRWE